MRVVALIPARRGSKRIPGKNFRYLGQHPLLAYTLTIAKHCPLFQGTSGNIVVSTDDPHTAKTIMRDYAPGYTVFERPADLSTDDAPDIGWVRHALQLYQDPTSGMAKMIGAADNPPPDAFMILRPTSPFRTVAMLMRAWEQFQHSECHSLRAVEPAKQHPGKMWLWHGPGYPITPVFGGMRSDGTPYHSSPTQTLPPVYVQNASLEIAWTYVVRDQGTIAGKKIMPFFTQGYEGFDVNTPAEWAEAERLLPVATVDQPYMAAPNDWQRRKAEAA